MKKYMISLLFAVGVNGACFSQNIWVDPACNNYGNSSLTETFYDPTVLLSPCNTYTTTISGTANVQILSKNEVLLQPGFISGSFSGSGMCEAKILPLSDTNSYYSAFLIPGSIDPSTNLPTIGQYQKLELGVNLPSWLQRDIDNFINGSRSWENSLNPYAQDTILVKAVFINGDNSYVRYGFYYENVNYVGNPPDSMSCISSYPGYNTNSITAIAYHSYRDNAWPFRIRFAPPATGSWSVNVYVYLPKDQYAPVASFSGSFDVITSSNTGYIVKGNNWHLKYVEGGSFFPIGENMYPYNCMGPNPYPCCVSPDNSSEWGRADPPSFVQVRDGIYNLAVNHGNYVRLRGSDEWGYLIDWDDKDDSLQAPGNYENRQYAAWELDKTVGMCENTNTKLQLVLFNDQFFSPSFQGNGTLGFSWQKGGNTYFNLLHAMYPSDSWDELLDLFFTNSTAMYYTQRYLFYMNARWGYSPGIATWELWNEADKIGNYSGDDCIYNTGTGSVTASTFQTHLAGWQYNIIKYLKSTTGDTNMPIFYPQHLITCGYAGIPKGIDTSWFSYDIFQEHQYFLNPPFPENIPRAVDVQGFTAIHSIPFLFGELGSNYDACQDISFHDASWAMGATTSGAGLYFSDWYQKGGVSHRANFNSLSTFFSQFDFENNGFFQFPIYYWDDDDHLEYYYIVDVNASLAISHDEVLPENHTPNTDNISTEIGWVHNLTTNYENNSYSYTCAGSCDSLTSVSALTSPSALSSGNVEFYGLNAWTDFNLNFLDTYSDSYFYYTNQTSSLWATISLSINFGTVAGGSYQPDYAYYIYESGHKPEASTSHLLALPNDTVYIPMDSLIFPGTVRNFNRGKFSWDFGNGQTSHSSYPKFIYSRMGNYLVTVDYADTGKKIAGREERTYVVLERPVTLEVYTNAFIIEPNPGTGIFTIIAKNNAIIDELDVTDATGKLCLKEISLKENRFDITSLAPGIYFVKIVSNSLTYNQKLIKL